jgi:DUF1009 family protein
MTERCDMDQVVAMIAGEGLLPVEIARRLTEEECPPVVYSLREQVGALSKYALDIVPVSKIALADVLEDMLRRGVRQVMLAGAVPKTVMYKSAMMDRATKALLETLSVRDDHTLLAAVVAHLERQSIAVVSYRHLIRDLLAPEGHVAGRAPTSRETTDAEYGRKVAARIVPLSFGQTLVTSMGAVVAVEAMEGTDATLLRAGSLCRGGTVVKMMRPDQDERYDLPTVGVRTLRTMARAGLGCLAIEAERTIILERESFVEIAREEGVAVIGIRHDPLPSENVACPFS